MEEQIKAFALENAVKFNGKANQGAVIGKILSLDPENKKDIKKISNIVARIVKEVNSKSIEDIKKEFVSLKPEQLKRPKKERVPFPDLPNAIPGKFVTRLPPEPSKYNHIGHGLSFLLNYIYSKKYKGKCVLKFEDTNPEKCTKEYADAMEDDIQNYLDIKPSKIVYISDHLDEMYALAEKMVKEGNLYVCTCKREDMQDLRHKGKECEHRNQDNNLDLWKDMLAKKFKPGEAVVRFKGDMESDNQVMRDPVLFRISDSYHFRHKDKYSVWPLYDFENSYGDGKFGVTHIMRSNEFGSMRNELQNKLKELMGYSGQEIIHYGRFNIRGATTKGREIREMIENGTVTGWDDPSLVTLKALKRRGILTETLYQLAEQVGLSSSPTNIDWTIISSLNRRILDSTAKRYFLIEDPVKIKIKGTPNQKIKLKLHPEADLGEREFSINENFLIDKKDQPKLIPGKLHRLMDCINFKDFMYDSADYQKFKGSGGQIIHWLPAEETIDVEVRMPDNHIVKGKGEKNIKDVKVDDVIQFTRFGFCRLDSIEDNTYKFWFTHK